MCIKSRPDLTNFLCVGTWRYKGSPLPFVDHKVALAGDDPGQVLRGGVDVGEDGKIKVLLGERFEAFEPT